MSDQFAFHAHNDSWSFPTASSGKIQRAENLQSWDYSNMDNPLQKIVRDRLEELETNPFEAAKSAGLERSFLNDILIGKKLSFRTDKTEQVARALQLDPKDFAARITTPAAPRSVPIMGYLGAGAEVEPEFEQVPPEGLDQIDLPFPVPDEMIAFKVTGNSMLPVYRPDHIIIVYREQRKPYF